MVEPTGTEGDGAPPPVTEAATPPPAPLPQSFSLPAIWRRIKHHKVMHWTLAYAAAAYTLLHGVEMLSEAQEWPHAIVRVLSLTLVLGVPVVITLAWYHGAKGLQRVSGPELVIITILLFIAGTALWRFSGSGTEIAASVATTTPTTSSTTTSAAPRTAVAVLPFANLTGDASKEYLGDGMAEELINTLTKVPGLKVPARTSTFAYKGRNTDIRQIAKDLGVGTILEGSVRAAGKRIRITAQLINAQDGLHLWSETYDEEFTDVFKLQDKLASEISAALQPRLGSAAIAAVMQPPPTRDVEAYDLFLQGESLSNRLTEANLGRAIELFQQAIRRDPKFGRAYAGIAEAHMAWGGILGIRAFDHDAAAERAARKALSLDSSLANAHNALAGLAGVRSNYLEMEAHARMALQLGANDGFIHAIRAGQLNSVGQLRAMLQEAQKAYLLAPVNPLVLALRSSFYSLAGRDADALRIADAAVELAYPRDNEPLAGVYALAAIRSKDFATASRLIGKTFDLSDTESARTAEVVRLVFVALADPTQRRAAIAARTRLYPRTAGDALTMETVTDLEPCFQSTMAYALLGAFDDAYELIDGCLDKRTVGTVLNPGQRALGVSWIWTEELRTFRRDSRFQGFVTRMGLMDYFQQYGPPDDCDLKDGKLTCR